MFFHKLLLFYLHVFLINVLAPFKAINGLNILPVETRLMCMMFGQLSNRDSLRDLLVCLTAHKTKHYHLGFGKNISRSNLAESNEKRDCQIFEMYAYELIAEAKKICVSNVDFDKSITGNVYAFDSTTIDLCLNVFWWACNLSKTRKVTIRSVLNTGPFISFFMKKYIL